MMFLGAVYCASVICCADSIFPFFTCTSVQNHVLIMDQQSGREQVGRGQLLSVAGLMRGKWKHVRVWAGQDWVAGEETKSKGIWWTGRY